MPPSDHQFSVLMQRVRQHSNGAARQLLERYGSHLLHVVRRRLSKKLRSQFDSVDFVQAVWASFFALPADKLHFDQPEALAAFLSNVARNKIIDIVRKRLESLKSGGSRELSLDVTGNCAIQEPSPLAVAIAREEWERLLDKHSDRDRAILTSIGVGKSARQTARELGVTHPTVQNVVLRARSNTSNEA